jgi:acyl carrier protein
MNNEQVIEMMREILIKQGKGEQTVSPDKTLRELGFRSLDFSELCLKAEMETDKEINFDANSLRSIESVSDVCNFLVTNLQ